MFDAYDLSLLITGLAAVGVAVLPRLLSDQPVSYSILYVTAGALIFLLPTTLVKPDPIDFGLIAERLAELGVIVALMGAGLKLDRKIGWKRWASTWRLLAITMPLSIGLAALFGWFAIGLAPAAAMLLGAALAPTDPVLAADVQVSEPGAGREDEVRFSLTSEAGLNDGLAFPFTNAAIAMAVAGAAPGNWFMKWLILDVVYRIAVALIIGFVTGKAFTFLVFKMPAKTPLAESSEGLTALSATLVTYALSELCGGYGFIAVFVAALTIRDHERDHEYHRVLHRFADEIERLILALVMVLFGGAIVTGLLGKTTSRALLAGLIFVLVIRPLTGWLALLGSSIAAKQRAGISFFGIRGVGSFYYLAHGLNEATFGKEAELWSVVGMTVLVSIVAHGMSAKPSLAWMAGRQAPRP